MFDKRIDVEQPAAKQDSDSNSNEEEIFIMSSLQSSDGVSSSNEMFMVPDLATAGGKESEEGSFYSQDKLSQDTSSVQSADSAVVTEIVSPSQFYVRRKKMNDIFKCKMEQHARKSQTVAAPKIKTLVFAQRLGDESWYRGKVVKVLSDGNFEIFFVDLGIKQTLYLPKY